MTFKRSTQAAPVILALVLAAGCGSSSGSKPASSPAAGATPSSTAASGAGALSADSRSAATGDVPDNQVFLLFTNRRAGYSMKYPEGWTQRGADANVTFSDKNNLVHVVVSAEAAPTPASVVRQLQALKRSDPSLSFRPPRVMQMPAGPAVSAVYTTESAPNPVTGKRVMLIVDRYELGRGSRIAVVDLGTPKGVDNVDAYRMMIRSFQWR